MDEVAFHVAAADSSVEDNARALVLCDGVADQVEINAALERFGEVAFAPGTYHISEQLDVSWPDGALAAMGVTIVGDQE